ncbi:MAG TPA: hypothetical protein VHT34_04580 [Clostridia bacterium]|nr:hypothetical protein [Clostridia bacterium]
MLNRKKKLKTVKIKYKLAWNPDQLRYIAILCSMIPGAVLYCLNYRKFNYPEKKKKILTILGATAVLTAFAILVPANKFFYIAFFFINAFISLYFAYDQKPAYDEFIKNGGYRATIVKPAILSALALVIYFIVFAILFG